MDATEAGGQDCAAGMHRRLRLPTEEKVVRPGGWLCRPCSPTRTREHKQPRQRMLQGVWFCVKRVDDAHGRKVNLEAGRIRVSIEGGGQMLESLARSSKAAAGGCIECCNWAGD